MTPNSSWCMRIVSAVREVSATGTKLSLSEPESSLNLVAFAVKADLVA